MVKKKKLTGRADKNRKKTKKKTISNFYKGNKTNNKILSFMCHESKNIYNQYLYCSIMFYKYKSFIYEDVLKNKIKENIDDYIISKFKDIYNFLNSNEIKEAIKENNNYIYNYIIDKYETKISYDNIDELINSISNKLKKDKNIKTINEWNYILIDYHVIKIVNLIYRRKFYIINNFLDKIEKGISVKNKDGTTFNLELKLNKDKIIYITKKLNKLEKFKHDSDDIKFIIKHVIKGKINEYNNIKTSHLKDKELELSSEQNILKKFVCSVILDKVKLPKDMARNIMDKVHSNISSFFALKKKVNSRANYPKFLEKNNMFVIPFYKRSNFIQDGNKIKLIIGKHIQDNFLDIIKDPCFVKTENKNTYYNSAYKGNFMNEETCQQKKIINPYYFEIVLPPMINYDDLKLIELIPVYRGHKFKFNFVCVDNTVIDDSTKTKIVSVDLGLKNIMTTYDTKGNACIFKGDKILGINEKSSYKISKLQSKLNIKYSDKIQKQLYNERINRLNKLNYEFNLITKTFKDKFKNSKEVILGYNANWKQNSKLYNKTNRIFQQIPFRNLIDKIGNKLKNNGTKLIEIEESYTSKCDALAYEALKQHEKYKGKRIKRGLFQSSTKKLINADVNGAINIMRKKYKNMEINTSKIFNPKIISW